VFLTLRIIHVVTGVFWAGTIFFMVSFLIPAMAKVGPGAGPVQAELARRKLFQKLPIIALLAIISGFWMYYLRMQGSSSWAPTNEAKVLGAGGVAALIAFIYGATVARPNQDRAAALAVEAATMPEGAEKNAKLAQAGVHRGKVAMAARIVATLIGITVIAMASARYV
jgi:uncharacterized membrane protein